MELGEFLKLLRMRHSLNQSEMGELCMRSKDWIYLVENGKLNPTNLDLKIISEKLDEPLILFIAYGQTINELFGQKEST